MLYEDLRLMHEDNERLEQAISDRLLDEPRTVRSRLVRDHEIAYFTARIHEQSERALRIYREEQAALTKEQQEIGTGDVLVGFYKRIGEIKEHHKNYPNRPIENLERAYNKVDDASRTFGGNVDGMFTGEEAFGRYFDLTMLHEEFLNLETIKRGRKPTYLQYLDIFDKFVPPRCNFSKEDKMTEAYFAYLGSLLQYIESFMRRIRPLEDLDKVFALFNEEFDKLWEEDKIEGWKKEVSKSNGTDGVKTEGTGEGVWCADCAKEFKNNNVYKAHLTGKKHIKAAEARKASGAESDTRPTMNEAAEKLLAGRRLRERAIAQREFLIAKYANAMQEVRENTRVNVERKAGMTERERQQEIDAYYAEEASDGVNGAGEDEAGDEQEKVYNPLKLPLAWDGNPIPFWLWKLHGLGVEMPCEICGNAIYMGRRAFEKHFSEGQHIFGLKCLGITSSAMFKEITKIDEALLLWAQIQKREKEEAAKYRDVEQMEDNSGVAISKKVYEDLSRSGLL